jgi:hypothetical protein
MSPPILRIITNLQDSTFEKENTEHAFSSHYALLSRTHTHTHTHKVQCLGRIRRAM